jgi:hypothetical protein
MLIDFEMKNSRGAIDKTEGTFCRKLVYLPMKMSFFFLFSQPYGKQRDAAAANFFKECCQAAACWSNDQASFYDQKSFEDLFHRSCGGRFKNPTQPHSSREMYCLFHRFMVAGTVDIAERLGVGAIKQF